eukprot:scaffold1245_cov252-Pinguiococcus_pyrenoidosus.AAC.17
MAEALRGSAAAALANLGAKVDRWSAKLRGNDRGKALAFKWYLSHGTVESRQNCVAPEERRPKRAPP